MSKKFLKIIIISFISVCILILFLLLYGIFNPQTGTIITNDKINGLCDSIKNKCQLNSLLLSDTKFEGDNKYISLNFTFRDYNSKTYNFYSIYNIKKEESIFNLNYKNETINIIESSLIKYIGNGNFIIITAKGSIYKYNPSSNKINFICTSPVSRKNVFKSTYYNDTIYIICRTEFNDYNESPYNDTFIYKIKNANGSKIDTSQYKLNKDDFAFSFAFDNNGNIGVVKSSIVKIPVNFAEIYCNSSNEDSISKMPSLNQQYRIINSQDISINFFEINKVTKLKDQLYVKKDSFYDSINSHYNTNIGYVSNVPFFISDSNMMLISLPYEYYLNKTPTTNLESFIYYNINTKKLQENKNIRIYDTSNFKYKKFIVFINGENGYYGIDKNGKITSIVKSNNIYIYDNLLLYQSNIGVKFRKI